MNKIEKNMMILSECERRGDMNPCEFNEYLCNLLVSENGWVLPIGNGNQCNLEIVRILQNKIDKHPLLWKLLFMVA